MTKIESNGCTTDKIILTLELSNKRQQFNLFVVQDCTVEHNG